LNSFRFSPRFFLNNSPHSQCPNFTLKTASLPSLHPLLSLTQRGPCCSSTLEIGLVLFLKARRSPPSISYSILPFGPLIAMCSPTLPPRSSIRLLRLRWWWIFADAPVFASSEFDFRSPFKFFDGDIILPTVKASSFLSSPSEMVLPGKTFSAPRT